MGESVAELFRQLKQAADDAEAQATHSQPSGARESLRRVMSAANKLHSRMIVLAELQEEAQFVAEVDRAIAKERGGRPRPMAGEVPLPAMSAKRARKPKN